MKFYLGYGLLFLCFFRVLLNPSVLKSANLTSVKDTLSTSRISVRARVDSSGTTIGGSNVKIQSSSSAPAFTVTTNNINIDDSLIVGTGTYTVVGIVDSLNFTVTPVILTGDQTNLGPIYLKMKPIHTVSFSTTTAVPNGFFQVLIPADATGSNDGAPDDQGYDFNTTVTVSATDAGLYDFAPSLLVATASGATGCTLPANYHCFEFHYSGLGSIAQAITLTVGSGSTTPIAPAPGDTTEATAETYPILVKNFGNEANPNSTTPIDNTTVKIALIEAVRVTATVDPTISMTICGDTDCSVQDVDPGDVVDGETLSTNTGGTSSGTAVALGVLDLLNARLQAQKITIATNGSGGYALTAIDDGNLREGSNTIDDNTAATDPATPVVLNSVGTEAYGIHVFGTHVDDSLWGPGGSGPTFNKYSSTDSTQALPLVSYTTGPTAGVDTYVIYKANISVITAQGDYAHTISYIATATF